MIITGKKAKTGERASDRTERVATSIAEDICAAATRGTWKMRKHLLRGLSLHHLTGSAQIVTIVNRLGHCSTYAQILQLETAMENQVEYRDSVLPYNVSMTGNIVANFCWDNFDLNEETVSGHGTTHSTHGIVIQEVNPVLAEAVTETYLPRKKQTSEKYISTALPPCYSKKRGDPGLISTGSDLVTSIDALCHMSETELLWTVCRALHNKAFSVPIWSGWVSRTSKLSDSGNVQQSIIGYMQPILFPITETSTVQHCLRTSMEASGKLKQTYTLVTMDLAAAKIAYDVKWSDPDVYNNVIINLGAFHTMCSYMGSLGKMMAGSGFEELVIEAGICASGSIDRVMSGKHYNRAMRVHVIMVDAVERLLLRAFTGNKPKLEIAGLEELSTELSYHKVGEFVTKHEFTSFMKLYNEFLAQVRNGKLGKTAPFWLQYVDCVWQLLRFHRAVKENNLEEYMSSMRSLCSLLFSSDHLNYARYLPLYYYQLTMLLSTHPGAQELLSSKGFSVSRSNVPACRNALDLTIEQTINRSAKSKGGIIGFSRKPAAYYRWCITRHTRATYLQATLERAGMASHCDDVHKSTGTTEIKPGEVGVRKVLEAFDQFQNPFDMDSDRCDSLFCLSSGKPASAEVEDHLLHYVVKGRENADDFIQTRLIDNSVKFQDTMKKLRLKTFQSMALRKMMTSSQKKTVQVKAERNLLGRLLLLSQDNDISFDKLFQFPLGPIPWSLATADGGMVKTNKSQLMHHLEAKVATGKCPPKDECIFVIDGNALLQSCVHLPETFEDLAAQIFGYLPKCQETHFVTDSYKPQSIKSFERNRRGQGAVYSIGGPKTSVPKDFKQFMCNAGNKTQLIKLLLSEWQSNKYAQRLHGRKVYFVCGEECYCLESVDGQTVTSSAVTSLFSDQEEADTRIVLHCQHASHTAAADKCIVFRSPDTDVLVILVSYSSTVTNRLLFETGTGNNQRVIDITSITEAVGPAISTALPALHAFTGCDCTSAFVRRGKVKPFEIMEKCSDYVAFFTQFGTTTFVDEASNKQLERFVCALYGKPSYSDVDKLRCDIFKSKYQPKSASKSFKIDDGVDLSLLPPCKSSLLMHTARANYVTRVWRNSHNSHPGIPSPIGFGWNVDYKDNITIEWNTGNIMPQDLIDVLASSISTDDEADDEADLNEGTDDLRIIDCSDNLEEDYEIDNIIDVVFDAEDGE